MAINPAVPVFFGYGLNICEKGLQNHLIYIIMCVTKCLLHFESADLSAHRKNRLFAETHISRNTDKFSLKIYAESKIWHRNSMFCFDKLYEL